MEKVNLRLSVIVPVYNAGRYLHQCVDSILGQTYSQLEIILVDDGSTDSSGKICDEYEKADSRVTAIHTKNLGSFQARKLGVKKSTGDILTFSDADDWLDENAFETMTQIFCKYNPDILTYAYDCGDGKVERHLYEEGFYSGTEIKDRIIPGMMYDSGFGGRKLNPSLCCKLIKRELYMKVAESVEDRITLGEDALVAYPAVCLAESIYICNKGLYHYNNNADSCTHTYPLERIIEVKAFQDNIMRLFNEAGILDMLRQQIESYLRIFLSMLVENWYGINLSPISFSFPYAVIPKNCKVFVYGAGNVGMSYINELKITGYAEIAGWADRKYEKKGSYNNINIVSPEEINPGEFDILLIAVWNEEEAESIRTNMIEMGIPAEKIVWRKPVRII